MDCLDTLLDRMTRSELMSLIALDEDQIGDALTLRDDPSFASSWMSSFDKVEAVKADNGILKDADHRVTKLREAAYLQAFDRWKSPDLAAYISDDFGLVGDAIVMAYSDPWLNALFHAYLVGEFPHGTLVARPGSLTELLSGAWKLYPG